MFATCAVSVSPLQLKSTSGTHISYENRLTTATEVYFRRPHFIWAPPFCFVGHSISRRVRFAGSRGPIKTAFCQSRRGKLVIPEQFTVKTHPVSVGWRRGVNNGAHLFQSTSDIDIQNTQNVPKMHEMYKLFIFCGSLCCCQTAKDRNLHLFINSNTKFQYACIHGRLASPKHARRVGASLSR